MKQVTDSMFGIGAAYTRGDVHFISYNFETSCIAYTLQPHVSEEQVPSISRTQLIAQPTLHARVCRQHPNSTTVPTRERSCNYSLPNLSAVLLIH